MNKKQYDEMLSYWKDRLLVDLSFLNNILESYSKELIWLWEMLKEHSTIEIQPLSLPNEVVDFLDGNGFILNFESGRLIITDMLNSGYLPLY